MEDKWITHFEVNFPLLETTIKLNYPIVILLSRVRESPYLMIIIQDSL